MARRSDFIVDVVLCKDNKVLVALYAGVSWKSQADGGKKNRRHSRLDRESVERIVCRIRKMRYLCNRKSYSYAKALVPLWRFM